MGVEPKIGGFYPPKWMVKIMENPIKMDDLGVHLFLETSMYVIMYVYIYIKYKILYIYRKRHYIHLLM